MTAWVTGAIAPAVAQNTSAPSSSEPVTVFGARGLSEGFDLGIDTANGLRNWARVDNDGLCLNYPGGQAWGAAFITVGPPRRTGRTGRDLSGYRVLSYEMRGQRGNENVQIAIKDVGDEDDGRETRVPVPNLTTNWRVYTVPLRQFRTADLRRVYVPFQAVFGTAPANVCVRNIRYTN